MAQYTKTASSYGCIWLYLFAILLCLVIKIVFRFIICPARFEPTLDTLKMTVT